MQLTYNILNYSCIQYILHLERGWLYGWKYNKCKYSYGYRIESTGRRTIFWIRYNLTTAFNIFVRQSLREGGIPFKITIEQPNKETIAAMLEAKRIAKDSSVKGYNDLDKLFDDLKRWLKQVDHQIHKQFQERL